jgi:D-alanine-D-alanine ligase-like ATP-grasp enzyme
MKSTCLYCGNNPVPHSIHKFYESIDILFSPIRRVLGRTGIAGTIDNLGTIIGIGLLKLLTPLGVVKINRDIKQIKYDRALVLWEEAIRQNIPIEEIKPFNRSIDLYRARINDKDLYFMNLPRRERVASSNLTWIDDKYLLKKKLREHNLPVSPGGAFFTFQAALKSFRALEKPVIVKPRAGSRGRHTTTFIYTEEDFKQAFKIAKQLCHWVMVEEHLFGDVQRGTVIGGKLVGVLGGSSPKVTGDGINTISALIKEADKNRPEGVKEIKINEYYMLRQGLTLDTVLPKGKTVTLSEKVGLNYGGTSYDCTEVTHPDTKHMLEEAGRVADISIAGFDFIMPDITKSWKEQKGGIIECNGAPFIQLHHHPLIGKPINAAKAVWDLVKNTD